MGPHPARHIVVSRAASPHGTSSCHGPHPARPAHRRAVSRTPHGLTGQTAPKGSHYSVAVGERSEPAEGDPPIIIGPKGVEHTVHAGRSDGTSSCRGLHPARPHRQTAPKGSHYSVAVGERSEPAEGGPPIIIGPKGVEHTVHAGRSAGTSSCHGPHSARPHRADGPEGVALLCSRG